MAFGRKPLNETGSGGTGNVPVPPVRSGSKLGAPSKKPGVSTGAHFGHHKGRSPGPRQAAGMLETIRATNLKGGNMAGAGKGLSTYFPDLGAFFSTTMDVYRGNGSPPPSGNPAATAVNILITGVFPEGSWNRGQQAEDYTHIILVDTQIEVHDNYMGNTSAQNSTADILKIPSGVANYFVPVFVFITALPNIGRKKVILADRRTGPGDFTKLV
jgi:hypothetical protein